MEVVFDAEFDSLTPKVVWVVVCKDINTKEKYTFRDMRSFQEFAKKVDLWIGANALTFDRPALNRLVEGLNIKSEDVLDLQIISRLVWFGRPGGHSVENFAKSYGLYKPPIDVYDDPNRIEDYVHRCEEDVEITFRMWEEFKRFIQDPSWEKAILAEHELALICQDMTENGFSFDVKKAENLLSDISARLEKLTNEIVAEVGDVIDTCEIKTLRRKKDGTPHKNTLRWLNFVDDGFKDGEQREFITYRPFNPGSVKDRIEFLNSVGWQPVQKTKTHQEAERSLQQALKFKNWKEIKKQQERLKKLRVTGWTVNETNLETLPKDAPDAAKKLAQWLTLEGRRADLQEWLDACNKDTGKIHGDFLHIGSWTHRMSHQNPNQANIFSITYIPDGQSYEDLSPVKQIKYDYDAEARSCWKASENYLQLGTDAEGIQLRVLAHLMGDEDYIYAVANGDKEKKTDVHNVNLRALGLEHLVRDDSKTFIYAWLLGAGDEKVASILRTSVKVGREAQSRFLENLPALRDVKENQIPRDAARGYFVGVDGRKVVCRSKHLMLAGYLQNGEKCVMTHANILWRQWAKEEGIPFRQIDFVHDEWQTEVPIVSALKYDNKNNPYTDELLRLSELQCKAIEQTGKDLGILCPLAGSSQTGWNWRDTH